MGAIDLEVHHCVGRPAARSVLVATAILDVRAPSSGLSESDRGQVLLAQRGEGDVDLWVVRHRADADLVAWEYLPSPLMCCGPGPQGRTSIPPSTTGGRPCWSLRSSADAAEHRRGSSTAAARCGSRGRPRASGVGSAFLTSSAAASAASTRRVPPSLRRRPRASGVDQVPVEPSGVQGPHGSSGACAVLQRGQARAAAPTSPRRDSWDWPCSWPTALPRGDLADVGYQGLGARSADA